MQVSHVNTFLDGGAALAAQRLHEELLKTGVDSRFYYSRKEGFREELGSTYQPVEWRKGGFKDRLTAAIQFRVHRESFKRAMRHRPAGYEVFTSPRGAAHSCWPPVARNRAAESDRRHDLIHLHWISKFIDYQSFFESMPPEQPIVWTLHDMNAFTGGCHFSSGCDRYQIGCGNCPQLADRGTEDVSRSFVEQKRASLRGLNLHVVAPSHWLMATAKLSPVFETARSFTHIPHGISSTDYYPMDRREARARLGIDPDVTLFCIGALDMHSRHHGARHLIGALEAIADLPDVEALLLGSNPLPKTSTPLPAIREVGPLHGLLHQRTVLSASDVFVMTSLEDNLPLTGLEAMACGAAVVGFDVGGIPDYVRPNQTGLLAKLGDTADFGWALRKLATWPGLARVLGENARRMIETEYTPQREVSAYQQLYTSLTASSRFLRRHAA
jgi:glycosyltransferase involved in cell wall biosynthesis